MISVGAELIDGLLVTVGCIEGAIDADGDAVGMVEG